MPNPSPQEFLEQAQQAEKAAENAGSERERNCWMALAQSYRELAAHKLKVMQQMREP